MDPSCVACPNLACPAKGTVGAGNIRVHSRAERRYRCRTCRRTVAATANTPLYRLHHPEATLTLVLTLLLHGCPIPAIVAACGLDERTVAAWLHRAGGHAARVQTTVVETGQVELGQVRVDEICVTVRRGRSWQVMALAVPSRLWLGGDLSPARDDALVTATRRRGDGWRRAPRARRCCCASTASPPMGARLWARCARCSGWRCARGDRVVPA